MKKTVQENIDLLTAILREHVALVDADEPLDVTLGQLVRGACDLANTSQEFGVLRIVDPIDGSLIQDIPTGFFQPGNIPRATSGVTHRVWLTRQIQNVPDVSSDPDFVKIHEHSQSELAVPLLIKDRCLGVLNLESDHRAHFPKELEPWIQALANQAVMTIKHLGLLDDIRRWEVAGHTGVDIEDLKARLLVVVEEALAGLNGKVASIAILIEHRDELVRIAFGTNDPSGANPGAFDSTSTIAWKAFSEQKVIEERDVTLGYPHTLVSGSRAALALPLHNMAGEVIGVFNVEASLPGALDGAQPLLQDARRHAEVVLQNHDDLAQFAPEEIPFSMQAGSSKMDPSGIQQHLSATYRDALRRAIQQVGGQDIGAALVLLDSEKELLTLTQERTYRYPVESLRRLPRTWLIRSDKTVVGECARTGEPVLAEEPQLVQGVYQPQFLSSRSELAAPLRYANGHLFGVLTFASERAGSLTQQHKQLLKYLIRPIIHAHKHAEEIRLGQFARERRGWSEHINSQIALLLEKQDLLDIRDTYIKALGELLQEGMKRTDSEFAAIMVPIQPSEREIHQNPGAKPEMILLHSEPTEKAVVRSLAHFPITRGITSRAYLSKRLVMVEDVSSDPEFVAALGAGKEVRSELAVPIGPEAYKLRSLNPNQPESLSIKQPDLPGNRLLGVFDLESSKVKRLSPEEVDWATFLSSQTAKLMTAYDAQVLRIQFERLIKLMHELMINLDDANDLDNRMLLHPIVKSVICDLTQQSDGYASLWLVEGKRLKRADYFTKDESFDKESSDEGLLLDDILNAPLSPKIGIVGMAFRTKAPMHVLDVTEPPWKNILRPWWKPLLSEVAVPILNSKQPDKQHPRGVLNVESRHLFDFTERDIRTLELLAKMIDVLLRNREIYQGFREIQDELGVRVERLFVDML